MLFKVSSQLRLFFRPSGRLFLAFYKAHRSMHTLARYRFGFHRGTNRTFYFRAICIGFKSEILNSFKFTSVYLDVFKKNKNNLIK